MMNIERINQKIQQLANRRKRGIAYKTHIMNTNTRQSRIAEIINNCKPEQVEELLTLIKHESKYIKEGGGRNAKN
jgi:hypothetical protein